MAQTRRTKATAPESMAAVSRLLPLLLGLGLGASQAAAAALECGVASAVFSTNTATIDTALDSGMSFWWNWNTVQNVDTTGIPPETQQALRDVFVPMLWGQDLAPDFSFMADHEGDVMGYNEPDQYGPACCNCDGQQTYSPATSSGWLPLFCPATAAPYWQRTVNNLTAGTWPPGPPGPPPPPGPAPPPAPPGPPPPPPPGPPVPPDVCTTTAATSLAGGNLVGRVCAALRLYDCCERIGQHPDAEAAVAYGGCCEYYSSSSSPVKHVANKSATLLTLRKANLRLDPLSSTVPSRAGPSGVRRIVSPAMAGDAAPEPGIDCSADPAGPGNPHFCHGWLSMLKQHALNMSCQTFSGKTTNCWDVVDALSIHAYVLFMFIQWANCTTRAVCLCSPVPAWSVQPALWAPVATHRPFLLPPTSSLPTAAVLSIRTKVCQVGRGCEGQDSLLLQRVPRGF